MNGPSPYPRPPGWIIRFLRWFCAPSFMEEVEGDLYELYADLVEEIGPESARRRFAWMLIPYLRPYFWGRKTFSFPTLMSFAMLRNYLTIAFRNMSRQKGYTAINLLGLAIGMAACLIILLFVQHELSYDRYHENSDRIFRVSRQWFNEDGSTNLHLGHLAPPFAPLLEEDFADQIEAIVRFLPDNPTISVGDKRIVEKNFYFAEPEVFEVFSWKLREGNPETALVEPNSLVLTESTARRYFGDSLALGKTLNYRGMVDMEVTAVVEDVPQNSHFQFDMLGSFANVEEFFGKEEMTTNFGSNNFATYLLLQSPEDAASLQSKMPEFLDRHLKAYNDIPASVYNMLNLWPLADIHLHSHLDSEMGYNHDISYVYISTVIAFLILLIACINFINLSTARAVRRAKEVGLRKVMGAFRSRLITQFLTESTLLALLSMGLAVLFVHLALPIFSERILAPIELKVNYLENGFALSLLFGITALVGLVAGGYPAFFISRFRPAEILRGGRMSFSHRSNLRSALVVLQFTISITLIIGVGIIQGQIDFMRSKPLGFQQEGLISLPSDDALYAKYPDMRDRLLQHPGIKAVSIASRVPSGRLLDSQGGAAEVDGDMKDFEVRIADIHVSHTYLKTLEVPFLAGRDFDERLASDSSEAFILNEAAVLAIGWDGPQDAIGKKFKYGRRQGTVIGVTEDFHFESLHQEINPIVFLVTQGRQRQVLIRIHTAAQDEVLEHLQEEWAGLLPNIPFSYRNIQDLYDAQYELEDRLGELIRYFSFLAVFIAALGLLGLASFTTERRFREIGIRKVLGASNREILLLLTRGFTVLVLIGFAIAIPLAYYGLKHLWLQEYAYQGQIEWQVFVLGGGLALFIAWATVGYQSWRAARSNPVEAIRGE